MSLLNIPAYDCSTESDVEQKFIFPLLTHPSFLDIPRKAVLTKKSLGVLSFVEKSALPKNYIPDYIIFFQGFPICVVEAKAPEVSIKQAIAEARMYAQLLNQFFPTRVNPVSVVMGCNGRDIAVGPPDTNDSKSFSVTDVIIGSSKLDELRQVVGVKQLSMFGERNKRSVDAATFVTPARRLNPQLFLERVKPNALAPYLTPVYEMFFRAEDPEKIQLILDKAYVDTAELREYDQVLHSMLRQIERALPGDYRTIQTDRKREYTLTPEINRYEDDITTRGRMHLIIGSRGAGKSLFVARFFSHLMPAALKERSVWFVVDFNRAPSSIDNMEDYVCEKLLETAENLQFDPYSLDGLNRVFAVDINRLNRGPLAAISDETTRERMLSTELLKLSADKRAFALRLGQHITGNANRPLIVAFDNVDRRESGQQLHNFKLRSGSAAKPARLLFSHCAMLRLKEDEPPLDAFAQISNFYIRPPRFALVLQKRLQLAIDVGLKDLQVVEQTSETGLRFKYDKEQLGTFLQTVYDALFGGEQEVGRIVDALAERDVREALGMFARMLASGHFNSDRVIKIGVGGKADIKHDMLIKILMRADYKLYSEEAGFIKNIFAAPGEGFSGNIFMIAEILGFFAQPTQSGTDRVGGYWRLEELISDMAGMGLEEGEVRDRVHSLIGHKMLAYDGEDTERPRDNDLIKITPSGFIHLRSLPHFIEYIASVALHAPFSDDAIARRIADIWDRTSRYPDLDFSRKHEVASMFANFLVREKNRLDAQNPLFKERAREAESVVRAVTSTVNVTASAAARSRSRNIAAAQRKMREHRTPGAVRGRA